MLECKYTSGSVVLLHAQHDWASKDISMYCIQALHQDIIICILNSSPRRKQGVQRASEQNQKCHVWVSALFFLPFISAWEAVYGHPTMLMTLAQTSPLPEIKRKICLYLNIPITDARTRSLFVSPEVATFHRLQGSRLLRRDHTADSRTWRPSGRRVVRHPPPPDPPPTQPPLHLVRPHQQWDGFSCSDSTSLRFTSHLLRWWSPAGWWSCNRVRGQVGHLGFTRRTEWGEGRSPGTTHDSQNGDATTWNCSIFFFEVRALRGHFFFTSSNYLKETSTVERGPQHQRQS